jgi:predicted DNA binding CopG/RHH family protein
MSDLFKTRKKVEEGAEWRGEINVELDGETMELAVRQMYDPEFWEVMSLVDMDELEELQAELPEEKMDEFNELKEQDDLDDDEQERLSELQAELESQDIRMFDALSDDTFEGIRSAAKYGWVPDEEDARQAVMEHGDALDEEYGRATTEEAKEWLQDHYIEPTIDRATGFASFAIGIKVLTETIGDTKNSES